jgi:hypothetical protein
VNRFKSRTAAVTTGFAVGVLAASMVLTGCSAGQISQTAIQQAAVNGAMATAGDIALRNIHLRAAQTTDYVQPGRQVELLLVASNGSPDHNDKLLKISSDIGAVSLSGSTVVPAGGALVVGTPDGEIQSAASPTSEATRALVSLAEPITNGLLYKFTFSFERGGDATVAVPISAGSAPRRESDLVAGEPHHAAGDVPPGPEPH